MFIFKICVWIKSGNIFLAHPVYITQIFRFVCNSTEVIESKSPKFGDYFKTASACLFFLTSQNLK